MWWIYIYSHPLIARYPQVSNLTKATDARSNLVELPLETKLAVLVIFIVALFKRMLSCCLYEDSLRTNPAADLYYFPSSSNRWLSVHGPRGCSLSPTCIDCRLVFSYMLSTQFCTINWTKENRNKQKTLVLSSFPPMEGLNEELWQVHSMDLQATLRLAHRKEQVAQWMGRGYPRWSESGLAPSDGRTGFTREERARWNKQLRNSQQDIHGSKHQEWQSEANF